MHAETLKRVYPAGLAVGVGCAVLLVLFLSTPWYVFLPSAALVVGLGVTFFRKMDPLAKRVLGENAALMVTGGAAVAIVLFVLFFLVRIFLLGKGNLSLSFFFEEPTEGLTSGGVFPAIVGTALLVIIMSAAGIPVGTITAIYLTEYASERSILARVIRFAVNTLAGVPAIVFGLFGLGFFIGTVGKQIDQWNHHERLTRLERLITSDASPFHGGREASPAAVAGMFARDDAGYWSEELELLRGYPETHGEGERFTAAELRAFLSNTQRPKWGQPALIWAALTMALLTLPVVIVSVEEAIKAVPRDVREASLALGATKWGTIRRVVIPGAFTGIMTGGILAVSRGAGEVAPILFTGAAYYLPELPNSLSSQFMELGYHIYVLTTQSTDVEATKPLLYATTFTLLILTFALNFSAIFLRSRIRSRASRLGQ